MSCPAQRLRAHSLKNGRGDVVHLLNFGARVASISLSLKSGPREVLVGYADDCGFLDDRYYLGCTAGRYCNRIAGARFTIDGQTYSLSANEGPNLLHGGAEGFDKRFWDASACGGGRIVYRLDSADGDQGFPGRLEAEAEYSFDDDRVLHVVYRARTDRPTHVSLTNHMYFNLDGSGDVLEHRLSIDADAITAVDGNLLPTGQIEPVAGSVLDLRAGRTVRELLESSDPRVVNAGGADFNYVGAEGRLGARLTSADGRIAMDLQTDCPGLQLYTGQHLRSPFVPNAGLCLEPQQYPDAPNQPDFPSSVLVPGREYLATTSYRFDVTD